MSGPAPLIGLTMTEVPLVDLKAQLATIGPELQAAIARVIGSAQFILGDEVEQFEREFSAYCHTKFAVGLDTGLSALELGMRALGIGPGDEVVTPVNSFIASSSAVTFAGATPVWAECDETTCNVTARTLESCITRRTRALMVVHLYGQMVEMEPIVRLANERGLYLIEDACQAHGARYEGRRAGSFGDFAAFSFYPGKNLGALGDGGALVTNSLDIADKVRWMRNYGQDVRYHHLFQAWNRRLDTIQAAILLVKLKRLDGWNAARRRAAGRYRQGLAGLPLRLPEGGGDERHVYHLFVIRTPRRAALAAELARRGIHTGVHYPVPIHLQPAYEYAGFLRGAFPVGERLSDEVLSLPMYPELSDDMIDFICSSVRAFFNASDPA